ncbi:MAG: CHAT domain-containing protein [Nitrospinae bacterium]|nr:CHAT domain-containing protein [Nitrospinota bacterium]
MKTKVIINLLIVLFVIGFGGCASMQSREALSLYNKGDNEYKNERYNEALEYFEKALNIYKSIGYDEGTAPTLHYIGNIYRLDQQYDIALIYYEEALKIDRKLNIPKNISTTLHEIGLVYSSLDKYDKALKYYEEALKIAKELNDHKSIATTIGAIAGVYSSLGQYDKAINYYKESLKIDRKLSIPKHIAIDLNNMGTIYFSIGRYDKSLEYFNESLKIKREYNLSHKSIHTSLNNIGDVYLSQRRYKEAEEKFIEAEKENEKTTGVKLFGNPGFVELYIATERYDEALKLLKEMIPQWNIDDTYRIQYHTQYGLALKGIGLFKEASVEFFKAVSISEEMRQKIKGEKGGFLGAGGAGGRIRAYRGLFSTLAERAIGRQEETPDGTKDNPLTPSLINTFGDRFNKGDFSSYGKDLSSAAFYFAESTKGRTLLEAMAESAKVHTTAEIPSELKKEEEDLLNQLSAIENRWEDTFKKGESALKELIERKEELKRGLDSLISKLRKEYPRYAALNYPKPIPAEELPLKEDEVLLEYAIGDDAGYVFVVRKGGVKKLIKIPLSREEIEEKVKAFMEPMNTKEYERFSVKEARELYEILLAEAVREIDSEDRSQKSEDRRNKKIIIVPDGILGLLPFEALVIPDRNIQGQVKEGKDYKDSLYVGDRYEISYYQSATVLALQRNLKERKTERPLFALGNPIYTKEDPRYLAWKERGKENSTSPISPPYKGGEGGGYKGGEKETVVAGLDKYSFRGIAIKAKWGKTTESDTTGREIEFSPLPETEVEVKEIAVTMGVTDKPPDVLLSMEANETEMRKAGLDKYRYIHFATHASLPGMIQGVNEPFILLGQVENESKDDGFLTLSEVLGLRLNADIVVLSACVTGVGKEVEGEGVANFARAFQHAGAESVIVSLWEVASEPAVEYMKGFYSHLKAGKSRGEAIRLSRNEIKARYPNPFYWAVFILHGEG